MSDKASIYWRPEWSASRAALGSEVPRVTGEELVSAMRENVAEAMANLARARTNLHRMRAAGGVVVDVNTKSLRAVGAGDGKRTRPDPLAVVAIADWERATAELGHWQEYLDWAKTLVQTRAIGAPDPRLPPERDDDLEEAPF